MPTHPESATLMNRLHAFLWIAIIAMAGVIAPGVDAQIYLPSMAGPHPDLSPMPDLQQPDTLIVQGGNPLPVPGWPNYCAPVSAANIWEFYDARDGTNLSPWMGDLPQPGPPFGWKMSWSTATIQGQGTIPGPPVQPLPPPFYMNTNGVGFLPPGWAGTHIQDIYQGVLAYAPAVETANGLTKGFYQVPVRMDELVAWEPPSPDVTVTDEITAFNNYIAAINADIPSVLSFKSWVQPGNGVVVGAIEYYVYNGLSSGDTGSGVIEQWDGSETGHAVTGIGYQLNYDPDGPMGPLPLADWYITRDNWTTTGADVAVPVAGQWMATVRIGTPKGSYLKWSQPPVTDETSPRPDCFYGWDEYSVYNGQWIVADDWECRDNRHVTDFHWWGSYINWNGETPPEIAPAGFQIGLWTDVPAGIDQEFSHPGRMIREWRVLRSSLNERAVGCDFFPERPSDICYRYDFQIPEADWFEQPGGPTVYWISIAALYESAVIPEFPWGWKTREHFFNDDAVRILQPSAPLPGISYLIGEPIMVGEESFDMAFEVTTNEPEPEPTPPPKWSQPPEKNPNSEFPSCFWGWDEVFPDPIPHLVADDWPCNDDRLVTDIHWWGSYKGWMGISPPPVAPVSFMIGVWTDVPANVDQPWSHPGILIWTWQVPMAVLNERLVGCDYYPGHPKDACFRYDFQIPPNEWFEQKPGEQNIYWITIQPQYPPETPDITNPWGWKTRPRLFQDAAVRIFEPLSPVIGQPFVNGEPILGVEGEPFDMAFELTTNSWPPPTPTPTGTDTPVPPTPTFTLTNTLMPTVTSTATGTRTATITNTRTSTPTNTLQPTPTRTVTGTSTATVTRTRTSTPTNTFQPTPTRTVTGTSTATVTRTRTSTPTNTLQPTPTRTVTGTSTATVTRTHTSTPTNTFQPTPTRTVTGTSTATVTRTHTSSPTNTPQPTATPTRTVTVTNTSTHTSTPVLTSTFTPTLTDTVKPTFTGTPTLSPTTHSEPTETPTPTEPPLSILDWMER